jgi:hypothetical protein
MFDRRTNRLATNYDHSSGYMKEMIKIEARIRKHDSRSTSGLCGRAISFLPELRGNGGD